MYNSTGNLVQTPEQHLKMIQDLRKQAEQRKMRWDRRLAEAKLRMKECEDEISAAEMEVEELSVIIKLYLERGLTTS